MSRVSRAAALLRRAAASAHVSHCELVSFDRVAYAGAFARACSAPNAARATSASSASRDWPCSPSGSRGKASLAAGTPLGIDKPASSAALTTKPRSARSRGKATRAGALGSDKPGPNAFTEQPRSLEIEETAYASSVVDRDEPSAVTPKQNPNLFIKALLSFGGFYSTESTNQRAADRLYAAVRTVCDDENWHEQFGVEKSFRGEHSVLVLHVWLLLKRLRVEGESAKGVAQVFYDTYQDDVEHRVHAEGVRVRVSKLLNELEQGFYGSAIAYDNALASGNGAFAKALHKNVYHNEGDESNSKKLEKYVRRELACLTRTHASAVLEGRVRFSSGHGKE